MFLFKQWMYCKLKETINTLKFNKIEKIEMYLISLEVEGRHQPNRISDIPHILDFSSKTYIEIKVFTFFIFYGLSNCHSTIKILTFFLFAIISGEINHTTSRGRIAQLGQCPLAAPAIHSAW